MFLYHYCKKINNDTFDEKIPFSKLNDLIEKFKLKESYHIKEYWMNNVQIINKRDKLTFTYIEDLDISYDEKNNFLIQEYIETPCKSFNFYETDLEDNYLLYENIINDITVYLKKYNNYLSVEFICDNKEKFNDFFYINNI